MTNPAPSRMQQSEELEKLLTQSRQMTFDRRSFEGIGEWIEQASQIAEVFQVYAGAIEEGCSEEEAWSDAESDLAEFRQVVNHLDAPSFLDDVYGDTEVVGSLSDLSRHILLGYAELLEGRLTQIHKLLERVAEDLESVEGLQGALGRKA
ncbi:hypothetical protein A9179_12620 [Pseudomonas alcaligenes]|uniref:Uncharacterized protein n=1 Tax=Aquipseudomonas alcaligenes TaxID=43263 RepID=A0ABR7S0J4_AQUAC|nr:hypothetical protein [Pseudomonas alcaligenes]MBC9251121.1 hypothetical protein [Pseudomonas alcaligenes]